MMGILDDTPEPQRQSDSPSLAQLNERRLRAMRFRSDAILAGLIQQFGPNSPFIAGALAYSEDKRGEYVKDQDLHMVDQVDNFIEMLRAFAMPPGSTAPLSQQH